MTGEVALQHVSTVLRLPHGVNPTPLALLSLLPSSFVAANIPTLDLDHSPAGTRHKNDKVRFVLILPLLQAQTMKENRLVRQLIPQDFPD